jgi:hypothetical protein
MRSPPDIPGPLLDHTAVPSRSIGSSKFLLSFRRCICLGIVVFVHLRVNFCPVMTGAAAVDFEFALPHMAHAANMSVTAINDLK